MQIFAYFSSFLTCTMTFEQNLWCVFVLKLIFLYLMCVFISQKKKRKKKVIIKTFQKKKLTCQVGWNLGLQKFTNNSNNKIFIIFYTIFYLRKKMKKLLTFSQGRRSCYWNKRRPPLTQFLLITYHKNFIAQLTAFSFF